MKTIGIDIGSFSIKLVTIETSFQTVRSVKEDEIIVPADESSLELLPDTNIQIPSKWSLKKVNEFIDSLPKKPDRIGSIIPVTLSTYRNIRIPSRDRKVLAAAIQNEIEDDLPFASSAAIIDFNILEQSKKSSLAHVTIVKKSYLESVVNQWDTIPNSPNVLTNMSWCIRETLMKVQSNIDTTTPSIIVDIGNKSIIMHLFFNSIPLLSRKIPYGTAFFEESIAEKLQMPLDLSQKLLLEKGFSQEDPVLFQILRNCIRPIFNQIKQINLLSKSITGLSITQASFIGGGASIPYLKKMAETKLSLTVHDLDPLSDITQLTQKKNIYDQQVIKSSKFGLAACIAFAITQPSKAKLLNLRQKEFIKKVTTDISFLDTYKRTARSWIAFCTLILLTSSIKYTTLKYFEKKLDSDLEKSLKVFYRDLTPKNVTSMVKQFSKNSKKIFEDINKHHSALITPTPASVPYLKILKKLSTQISRSQNVDLCKIHLSSKMDLSEKKASIALETSWKIYAGGSSKRLEDIIKGFYEEIDKETTKNEDGTEILLTKGNILEDLS